MNTIAIVEPHYDDAWINLGGFILLHPEIHFLLVTLSDYPTNNIDGSALLASRLSNISSTFLGYKSLGFDDAHMQTILEAHQGMSYIEIFLSINNLDSFDGIKKEISNQCAEADVVMWPLGLKHPQHMLMKELNPFPKQVYLYREFPYFFYEDQKKEAMMRTQGMSKNRIDVCEVLDEKIKLFKESYPEQEFIADLVIDGTKLSDLQDEVFWSH